VREWANFIRAQYLEGVLRIREIPIIAEVYRSVVRDMRSDHIDHSMEAYFSDKARAYDMAYEEIESI